MEQVLAIDDLLEFETVTQFPIVDYFIETQAFLKKDVSNISGFYSGNLNTLDRTADNNLLVLTNKTQDLLNTIDLNKNSFKNYKWWLLLEIIEQNHSLLLKLNTASRWFRSSVLNDSFNSNPLIDIKLNQGQTLESISRNTLGSSDWDNTWVGLAQQNDLTEEQYTSDGGLLLQANFNFSINNVKINAIVDNPVGDRVLGFDLQKKIEFDSEENDLIVLSSSETFLQTVDILINLRQGDNPEFPDQGLNSALVIGSNLNSLSYPAVFRSLMTLFKNDDTIKTFNLVNIAQKTDGVFINFEVVSKLGNVESVSLSI